jgi:hypothetical protein
MEQLAGLSFGGTPLTGGFSPNTPSPTSTGGLGDIADRILDIGSDFLGRRQDREDLKLAASLNRQQALTSEQVLAFAARLNQGGGTIQPATVAAPAPGTGINTTTILLIAAVGIGAFALLR